MMMVLFHAYCFLVPTPISVPLFALALTCTLVAVADGLLGMVHVDASSSSITTNLPARTNMYRLRMS
jgi:hypothetical protein